MAKANLGNIAFLYALSDRNGSSILEFFDDCVDELTGLKQADFEKYQTSDIESTLDDFNKAKDSIIKTFRDSVLNGNFEIYLEKYDTKFQESLEQCFAIRKNDIMTAVVKESLINDGHKVVENIDWKVKMLLGSNSFSSDRTPVVQVDFSCLQKGPSAGTVKSNVNFEIDRTQLDSLINQLEAAKSELKFD